MKLPLAHARIVAGCLIGHVCTAIALVIAGAIAIAFNENAVQRVQRGRIVHDWTRQGDTGTWWYTVGVMVLAVFIAARMALACYRHCIRKREGGSRRRQRG